MCHIIYEMLYLKNGIVRHMAARCQTHGDSDGSDVNDGDDGSDVIAFYLDNEIIEYLRALAERRHQHRPIAQKTTGWGYTESSG